MDDLNNILSDLPDLSMFNKPDVINYLKYNVDTDNIRILKELTTFENNFNIYKIKIETYFKTVVPPKDLSHSKKNILNEEAIKYLNIINNISKSISSFCYNYIIYMDKIKLYTNGAIYITDEILDTNMTLLDRNINNEYVTCRNNADSIATIYNNILHNNT